jgi:uncharacterized protein
MRRNENHANAYAGSSETPVLIVRRTSIGLLMGGIAAGLVGVTHWSSAAFAQSRPSPAVEAASSTFLPAFPEGDAYKLQVYGDSFAEGLTTALVETFGNEPKLQISRKHRSIGALIRPEWEDDIKPEDTARETVHAAVIMLGLQDRQIIKPIGGGKNLSIGTDEWREEYGRRFDRLLRALKKRNIGIYVVGQPVMRQSTANTQAEMISEIMRQQALAAGAKFIDIHEAFQDDSGGFSQFGPDISGARVKLRDGDGVTLTGLGNKKLAHFVEREVRRDIEQAASDRAIALAGDDAEQKRINPAKAAGGAPTAGWKGSVTVGQTKSAVASNVPVAVQAAGDGSGDQKADNGRVTLKAMNASGREDTIVLDIVRPAIPAAVIALVTRREAASAEKAAQPGEAVVEDVGGGLTVVNSVSMLGDTPAAGAGKRKLSATQTAFYTVLVKGDRLAAKPGRADDFSWPRNDTLRPDDPQAAAKPAAPSGPKLGPAKAPAPKTAGQKG